MAEGRLTLHLVRHGDTTGSADGTYCGDLDVPLLPSGVAQAERLACAVARLAPRALYVSPKARARATAAPVEAATGLVARVEEGLREIAYGAWEGLREDEARARDPGLFAAWTADPSMAAPPGGETAFAIAARALPVLRAIRDAHADGDVVVVSHKATIRVLVCALLDIPLARFRDRIACPTASLTSVEMGRRGPMLVRVGDTTHLEAP